MIRWGRWTAALSLLVVGHACRTLGYAVAGRDLPLMPEPL